MPNPTITPAVHTPGSAYTINDSDDVFVDLSLVEVSNQAVFTVDCPTSATVSIERAPGDWTVIGSTLLSGGAWSVAAVPFGGWQADINVAGSVATITVTQLSSPDASDLVRLRISDLAGAACVIDEDENATIERVLADPALSGLSHSAPVTEGAVVLLTGTVAHSQVSSGLGSLAAVPALAAQWSRSTDALAFSLSATNVVGAGPATAEASFTVPGVYASATVGFELQGWYDLDASGGAIGAGEPDTVEAHDFAVAPGTYHMVLVIDRSGSMSSGLGGGASKWQGAVAAAHLWSDFLLAFRPGSQHRLGLVTFEHDACGWGTAAAAGDIGLRSPSPVKLGEPSLFDVDAFDLGNPGSCTPIGDGLVYALDQLVAESTATDVRRILLLLTDGYENAGKVTIKANPPASGVTTWTSEQAKSVARQNVTDNLDLYTIAVGQETEEDLLNDLPNPVNGVGYYHLTQEVGDLLETFADMLGNSVDAQSISPIGGGDLAQTDPGAAGDTTNARYAVINAGEQRLAIAILRDDTNDVVKLAHRPQGSAGAFTLLADGPAVSTYNRAGHVMVVVDLAAQFGEPVPATEWRIQLRDNGITGPALAVNELLIMVDLQLKAEIAFDRSSYRIGQPIQLDCRLLYGRTPVTDATITVEMAAPGEGLGTFLATHSDRYKPGSWDGQDGDVQAPKQHMFTTLLRILGQDGLPVVNPVFGDGTDRLHDDGSHGDGAANDGRYGNAITATDKEGSYRFRIRVRGEIGPDNRFDRVFTRSTWVGVAVDPAATPVLFSALPAPGAGQQAWRISLQPQAANGELLGPFRADEVVFVSSEGSWQGPVVSGLDGTYSRDLQVTSGGRPVVQITIHGVPLRPAVIDDGKPGDGDCGPGDGDGKPGPGDCERCGCFGLLWRALLCCLGKGSGRSGR